MSLLTRNKKLDKKEAKNNLMLFVIALICAIAGWLIIAMKIYPSASKEILNVPVELDTSGTDAGANGLQAITPKSATVKVTIDCSRTNFSKLNRDSIRAYVDYNGIVNGGTKPLTVKVESTQGVPMSSYTVTPSVINVNLDKFDTKTIVVKPSLPKIKIAEGMAMDENAITCDPVEVKITAPSRRLAQISECYAVYDKDDVLDRETSVTTDKFQLYDENGSAIAIDENIKIEPATVSMTIPVLTQKTVKIGVKLYGQALTDNFDPNCLNFTIVPDTVTIAAKNADSNIPDPLEIYIDLNSLDIGYSEDTDLDKQLTDKNLKNVSGIDKVNITLNSEGLASRWITLNSDDIPLTNKPSDNNEYTLLTQQVRVKIVGPEDVINDITAKDLKAEVSLLGADTSKDQFKCYITVSCKTHNNVWYASNEKLDILKTPKEGSTSSSSYSSAAATTN
jgi:YbbR domain-containing protein